MNMGKPEDAKAKPPSTIKVGDSEMFAVPASVSAARAATLLPSGPSEDARHILGHIEIPRRPSRGDSSEYLPLDRLEWVITCDFGDAKLDPKTIAFAFDKEWRQRFGGFTGYGKDAATGRWTFLLSANGPKEVTAVKLAWRFTKTNQPSSREVFDSRLADTKAKLSALGQCDVRANLSPAEAVTRSEQLQKLKERFDLHASLKLVATETSFGGKAVWDVLQCLGLKWGDMDCFHWDNRDGVGDQAFFSVQTSTPPGYFLPEQVAAGKMNPKDLVFVYSIPRSAAPVLVFQAMCRALKYLQRRLGGRITFSSEKDADLKAMEQDIAAIDAGLKANGFAPGSTEALRFF